MTLGSQDLDYTWKSGSPDTRANGIIARHQPKHSQAHQYGADRAGPSHGRAVFRWLRRGSRLRTSTRWEAKHRTGRHRPGPRLSQRSGSADRPRHDGRPACQERENLLRDRASQGEGKHPSAGHKKAPAHLPGPVTLAWGATSYFTRATTGRPASRVGVRRPMAISTAKTARCSSNLLVISVRRVV